MKYIDTTQLLTMLPAQRNKVDVSKLTPDEQKAFRLYGKLPAKTVNKSQERKYFDSGDWALSRSGNAEHANVSLGKSYPKPDEIPHASPAPIPGGTPGSSISSSSPPSSIPVPGALSPGSATNSSSNLNNGGNSIGESGINLSMSPGRVGVGQPLATSPTRSFSSFPGFAASTERTSPTTSTLALGNPLVPSSSGGLPQTPMLAGTTGNQIGKVQTRSQTDGPPLLGGPSSPPPTSGLAQSISAHQAIEDDEVDRMEGLQ